MSLSETRKLLQQSIKVVEESGENTSTNNKLTMILNLVSSIDKRLQNVENSVGKFDEIKNIITSITSRVLTTEKNIKECQRKVVEVETGLQGVGNLFDNLKTECDKSKAAAAKCQDRYEVLQEKYNNNKTEIQKLSEKVENIKNRGLFSTCNCSEHIQRLENSVLDLKCRSMKNNLIFTGLYEVRNENTEDLLRAFLRNEIGIDYHIEFGNVHRFGYNPRGRRPIVARFLYHNDLQYVLDNAYRLRNSPYGIRQQFPKEIEDARKPLYPIQKEAKRQGKTTVMVRDRLYIDNELYVAPDNVDNDYFCEMDETEPRRLIPETPVSEGRRRQPKRPRLDSSTPTKGH